jgi:hypothetical protein
MGNCSRELRLIQQKGPSFVFDRGTIIQTWPWVEGNDDQWMLYMTSGNVFTYRADGRYCLGPGTKPSGTEDWQDL